ncbi:MAG: translation initiation factor 2 [Candidatus Sedimenticola sp. 20ELBAFRAG]
MANEPTDTDGITEEAVSEEQFLRAVTSFEAIILSQIKIKNKISDRLNAAIRAGIIILGLIAVSILILLLTLSSQINRITGVVTEMNKDFTDVSGQMLEIRDYMDSMEKRVALMESVTNQTGVMDTEVRAIAENIETMQSTVSGIKSQVAGMRHDIGVVSGAVDHMNVDVQRMGVDMHRMGQPARSMNKMFPFP